MHYSLLSYAATALCSGLFYSPLLAQPLPKVAASALYVNDLSQTGDLFTSAAGSDATGTGSTSAPFATVAAALSAADAGTTTIYIDAGTYSERVVLSKNISLQGAGTATNVPASATVFNGGLADGAQANEVGIYIATSGGTAAAPVVLADFTVRNYDYGVQTAGSTPTAYFVLEDIETVANRRHGIEWNSLVGTRNIIFRRLHAAQNAVTPNTNSNGAGRGLFLVNGVKENILIEDGLFEQNRRAGIDVNDGSVGNLVIRGCRFFQNAGPGIAVLGAAGIRNASGSYTSPAALLENNGIRDNASNGMELKACTGTGRPSGAGSFVVRNNYIARSLSQSTVLREDNAGIAFIDRDRNVIATGAGVNGDLLTGGAFIQGNTVRGYRSSTGFEINGFGIVLEGLNNKVFNNILAQCQRGVQIQDRPASPTIGFTPFFDIDRGLPLISAGDSIRQNRIDSCTTALRGVNLTNVVEAGLNWLGNNTFAAVRGASGTGGLVVTLGAPNGFAEQSSFDGNGRIDYSPFLDAPTDATTNAGFQPMLTVLHVDRSCPTAGDAGRLQEGVTLVVENGTVNVAEAMYDEAVTVSKNLTLKNTGPATTLQQLTLNGTGKNITLGSPFNLSGTLTLNAGLLITTASNLLTLTAEASSTEGSAGSYVNGPVQKVGSTAFVFPLGKDGVWARLAISAPATPTAAFTAEYIAASHPVSATTSPLDNVSRIEYWNLTRSAGSDDVAVRLFWQDAIRSGIDEFSADLQVARYDGSTWLTEGNGSLGGSLAAGSVVSEGAVGGYGAFSFGSLSPQVNPLPVELLSFRAAATQPGSVQLSWATASETKNKGFGIERSPDGQTWQQVAFVAGRGTSTQQQQYTHLDVVKAANTTLYYRLRQQDVDGKATYSQVAAIRLLATEEATAVLYPNPAPASASFLTLTLPTVLPNAVPITISDLTGRVVHTQLLPAGISNADLQLPATIPAGNYLLQVGGPAQPQKVIRWVRQ